MSNEAGIVASFFLFHHLLIIISRLQELREHLFINCEISPLKNLAFESNQENAGADNQEPPVQDVVGNSDEQLIATKLMSAKKAVAATDNYNCKRCSNTFNSQATLNQHLIASHGNYVCDFCDKIYKDRTVIQRNNDMKLASFGINIVSFLQEIVRHLFVHRGFLPYNCPTTDCSYTNTIRSQ
jgi:hypothetical protein